MHEKEDNQIQELEKDFAEKEKQYTQEIADLKQILKIAEMQIASAKQAHSLLVAKLRRNEKGFRKQLGKCEETQKACDKREREIMKLVADLTEEIKKKSDECVKAEETGGDCARKLFVAETNLNEMSAEYKMNLDVLREKVRDLNKTIEANTEQRDSLKLRVETLSAKEFELNKLVTTMVEEREASKAQADKNAKEMDRLKRDLKKKDGQYQETLQELKTKAEAMNVMEDRLKTQASGMNNRERDRKLEQEREEAQEKKRAEDGERIKQLEEMLEAEQKKKYGCSLQT